MADYHDDDSEVMFEDGMSEEELICDECGVDTLWFEHEGWCPNGPESHMVDEEYDYAIDCE
jgi:hypothetical protein